MQGHEYVVEKYPGGTWGIMNSDDCYVAIRSSTEMESFHAQLNAALASIASVIENDFPGAKQIHIFVEDGEGRPAQLRADSNAEG